MRHCYATIALMAVLLVGLLVDRAPATIIYFDDFDGGAEALNGTAPDTRPSDETWTASDWKANGSVTGSGNDNAFLPFEPADNLLYTLSLDVNPTSGGADTWFALGFTQFNATTTAFYQSEVNAGPWMLMHGDRAKLNTLLGPACVSEVSHDAAAGWVGLDIVLDTRPTDWAVEWFRNGTSIRADTYLGLTKPTIKYVGFGRFLSAGGSVDNFKLTIIPEPSTLVLVAMGLLVLAGYWRWKRRR